MNLAWPWSRGFRRPAALLRVVRPSVFNPLFTSWLGLGLAASALYFYRVPLAKLQKNRHQEPDSDELKSLSDKVDRGSLDALPIHFCILDENGTLLSVNRAWREFANANPPVRANVCEGANYLSVCDRAKGDRTASVVASAIRALIAGELSDFAIDYPCHSPTEERWFTARASRYVSNGAVRVVVAHESITESKLAKRALGQSEERYRLIIEQALDGVFVVDPSGHINLVNEAACTLTGYPREELIGMPVMQIVPPDELPRFTAIWQKLLAGEIERGEWPLVRKDGVRLITEIRARAQSDGHVVAFSRDITERKQSDALKRERDAADAANRAKDQFLAMLSHELRTPLAPVLMASLMIEQDEHLPEHVRGWASMIHRNIDLQARLIDDLLDQTRIARDKLELHCTRVSVHNAIEHVVEMLHTEFESKQLQVHVEMDAEHPQVRADAARLQQILWNLLKNAAKFTSPGGMVTVRTSNPTPDSIRIEVIDTGIGIEPDLIPRLFRPFEQGGTKVTRRYGGLGLGLVISERLARLHGGTLKAYSEGKNRGATFIVDLPRITAPTPEISAPVRPTQVHTTTRNLRILLVEDHADTARMLKRLLERRGHQVSVSHSLHDAEQKAGSEPFDMVLSDLDLPDGTGYELMEFLRKDHPLPSIAMSGFGMEEDVRKSREAGFAEHLVKPVDPLRLEEAIEHVAAGMK